MNNIISIENNSLENQSFPNYSLEELRSIEFLSLRAYNICKHAHLNDLDSIIQLFNSGKENDLLRFKNCGQQTISKMRAIYNQYKSKRIVDNKSTKEINTPENESYPDINYTISELMEIGKISVRAYNICYDANLKDINAIIEFFISHDEKDFYSFRNCGSKTVAELRTLFELNFKYYQNINDEITEETIIEESNIEFDKNYSISELKKLKKISEKSFAYCTVKKMLSIEIIFSHFINFGTFSKPDYCANDINQELINLCIEFQQNGFKIPMHKYISDKIYERHAVSINDYIQNFNEYIENRTLPLFKTLEIIFSNCIGFQDIEKELIKYIFLDKNLSMPDIALKYNLSLERIRQLAKKLLNKIYHTCRSPKALIELLYSYCENDDFKFNDNLTVIDKTFVEKINKKYNTNFTEAFILQILSYHNDNYNFINLEIIKKTFKEILFHANKRIDDLNHYYFVKKDFESKYIISFHKYLKQIANSKRDNSEIINKNYLFLKKRNIFNTEYKNLLKNIKALIVKRNNKYDELFDEILERIIIEVQGKTSQGIYSSENKTYISKHVKFTQKLLKQLNLHDITNFDWTTDKNRNLNLKTIIEEYRRKYRIIKIEYNSNINDKRNPFNTKMNIYFNFFKIIAKNEFEFPIDNSSIIIKRNTVKKRHEFIIEILEKRGIPMQMKEIISELEKLNLDFAKDESAIRAVCLKRNEIISFGRSSTYGLKKWEKEKPGIKGGSIRDMVIEYLEGFSAPVHIDRILEHVNKYRDTYKISLLDNLKLDKNQKRFCFFPNGYIGLTSKNYNDISQLSLFSE